MDLVNSEIKNIKKQLFSKIDTYKKEIDSYKPFSERFLRQLIDHFKIGLTYTSNALEGNSLTISETKVIIENGLTVSGKPLRDTFEVVGHSEAFDYMYSCIDSREISQEIIRKLHYKFYRHMDDKNAGEYRKEAVIITGSQYSCPDFSKVPDMMENMEGKTC